MLIEETLIKRKRDSEEGVDYNVEDEYVYIDSEVIIRKIIIWYYKNMYMYYIYVLEIFFDFNSMDMFSINWYNYKVFIVMFKCI